MDHATEAPPSPADAPTSPPRDVSALARHVSNAPAPPSADAVLRAVVEARGPWFPHAHAARTATPRHALDAPLAELRDAGLVRVAEWVKGLGQGYVATPDGERVAEHVAVVAAGPEPISPTLAGLLDFRPPLVTPALMGANAVWFAVGVAVSIRWGQSYSAALGAPWVSVIERLGAVSADDLLRGEWARLVTCAFVHIGFWHLAINTVALGTTGPVAELLWGRWRTLGLYFLAALASAAAAMAFRPLTGPSDAPVIVAGASGATWGLLGAVVAWFVHYRHDLPADVATDMGRRLGFAVLLNVGICFLPQMSWEGHLAGGLVGYFGAGLFNAARFNPYRRRLLAAALLAAVPVVAVGGLVLTVRFGDEWATIRDRRPPAPPPAAPPPDPNRFLVPLRPEAAEAARWAVVKVWLVGPAFRDRARVAARAELDALRPRVVAVVNDPAAACVPAGDLRPAAAARAAELDLLRELAERATMPTEEDWRAWGDRRREADRFWKRPDPPAADR